MPFFDTFKNRRILPYTAGIEASGEYLERTRVKKTTPKIQFQVSPFIPPFLPLEIFSEDMGGLIKTFNFVKGRNQSHGTVSITMAADDARATESIASGFPVSTIWRQLGKSLEDLIRPRSFCQIWMDGYHIFTGFVRSIRRSSDNTEAIYTIECDELGVVYNESILNLDTILLGEKTHLVNSTNKIMSFTETLVGPQPMSVSILAQVNSFLASTLNYGLRGFPRPILTGSDGLPLAFRLIAQASPLGAVSNSSLVSQIVTDTTMFDSGGGGTFWSHLKNQLPETFMECWTETGGRTMVTGRSFANPGGVTTLGTSTFTPAGINLAALLPGFNYLAVRTNPFDIPWLGFASWSPRLYPFTLGVLDLLLGGDFIIITDDDILFKDIGRSDYQQHTVFHTGYSAKSSSNNNASLKNRPSVAGGPLVPLFPGGVRTFGNKLMQTTLNTTSLSWASLVGQTIERVSQNVSGTGHVQVPALASLLNFWFRNQHNFREGTVTTRAIPYARPGMIALFLPSLAHGEVENARDLGVYYIENVSHTLDLKGSYTTNLSLTRGTPMPVGLQELMGLLLTWDVGPIGFELFDGSPN